MLTRSTAPGAMMFLHPPPDIPAESKIPVAVLAYGQTMRPAPLRVTPVSAQTPGGLPWLGIAHGGVHVTVTSHGVK